MYVCLIFLHFEYIFEHGPHSVFVAQCVGCSVSVYRDFRTCSTARNQFTDIFIRVSSIAHAHSRMRLRNNNISPLLGSGITVPLAVQSSFFVRYVAKLRTKPTRSDW